MTLETTLGVIDHLLESVEVFLHLALEVRVLTEVILSPYFSLVYGVKLHIGLLKCLLQITMSLLLNSYKDLYLLWELVELWFELVLKLLKNLLAKFFIISLDFLIEVFGEFSFELILFLGQVDNWLFNEAFGGEATPVSIFETFDLVCIFVNINSKLLY